jgi:phosphatidate cytidylyltransferase
VSDDAGAPHGRAKKHPPTRAEIQAGIADVEAQMRARSDKINARSGRNLGMAVLIGLGLGGGLLASLLIFKELFMLFAGFLLVVAAIELASALRSSGRDIPRTPIVIAALVTVPASFYPLSADLGFGRDAGHWFAILFGIVLVTLWRLVELLWPSRRAPLNEVLKDLAGGVLIMTYVVFLASFAVVLTAKDGGQWWTLAFLIIVVSTDVGAYATGLRFGKHPMAPKISPKKTWEGFAGAAGVAIIAGILLAIFMLQQPWWVGVILAVTMLVTAVSGDLVESLIKRDLGIKDISSWLPGHGGLLDRLDSILLSAPVAYALFLIFT